MDVCSLLIPVPEMFYFVYFLQMTASRQSSKLKNKFAKRPENLGYWSRTKQVKHSSKPNMSIPVFFTKKILMIPKWRNRPTKRHSGSIFCRHVMVYTWILGRLSIETIHISCLAHNGAPGISAGKQSCTNHLCRGWVGRFHFLYCRVILANRYRRN